MELWPPLYPDESRYWVTNTHLVTSACSSRPWVQAESSQGIINFVLWILVLLGRKIVERLFMQWAETSLFTKLFYYRCSKSGKVAEEQLRPLTFQVSQLVAAQMSKFKMKKLDAWPQENWHSSLPEQFRRKPVTSTLGGTSPPTGTSKKSKWGLSSMWL